ncbi:methylthioribulose 1-phosphate dehydratase [Planctomycetota bacterium]|nr:methylthioribulose 1-phosphate dehydratase [Planctomycetota bacterium]
MSAHAVDALLLAAHAREIVAVSRFLSAKGWSPATSSNYSSRIDDERAAITCSGKDKGSLTEADVLVVTLDGRPVGVGTPSAETRLHTRLYARYPEIGAVLHVHTINATVVSRACTGDTLTLQGYELQKAFAGVTTHKVDVQVPIFENSQDMHVLARQIDERLGDAPSPPGYLIRGHGLYAWGANMPEAKRHVEAFDFLFGCHLEELRLAR